MPTLLLKTKLYIPHVRAELVSRPRLIEQLSAGLGRKLTLISAPAGFGKTTLLSEFAIGRRVAWLSLDEHDNDLPHFFTYLAAALRTIDIEIDTAIFTTQQPRVETFLVPLLNQLATAPRDFILVLDDYHVIDNMQIHHSVAFTLEHAPPQSHLILSSRADPPLPLARLRAQQQLTELRAADLSFRPDEATAFFRQFTSPSFSDAQITALENRTEGWIAGLQLAAHALQGQDAASVQTFIDDFGGSHRYVIDYLANQVFYHQPESIQRFLVQTAILQRFCADLCDAVTERDGENNAADGHAALDHLDQCNVFLVALDGQRHWYRYHHLFAEFLRQQLSKFSTAERSALHRRAGQWYAAHGFMDEAIEHALAAHDWDTALRSLHSILNLSQLAQHYQTWEKWMAALPQDILRAEPVLCVNYAWALMLDNQLGAAKHPLQMAKAAWQTGGDEAQFGTMHAVRALLECTLGDTPAAICLAEKALVCLPQRQVFERGVATLALATGYLQMGRARAAEEILVQKQATSRLTQGGFGHPVAMALLGQTQVAQGKLRQASRAYTEAQRLTEEESWRPMPVIYTATAQLYYEWNELDKSAALWQTAIKRRSHLSHNIHPEQQIELAQLQWARGDARTAHATLDQAARDARQLGNHILVAQIAAWRARLWLVQGNFDAAISWLHSDGAIPMAPDPAHAPDYARQGEYLTRVRVLMHQSGERSLAQAGLWLTALLAQAETDGRQGDAIEILALRAILETRAGRPRQAIATLEQALTLAEPEGYVRTFIDLLDSMAEGQTMTDILPRAAQRGIAPAYVARLLRAAGVTVSTFPAQADDVNKLSEREIQVITLITAGYSTPKIAETLLISIHTARTHVRNIYRKLDAHSRVQAVEKARALGLV